MPDGPPAKPPLTARIEQGFGTGATDSPAQPCANAATVGAPGFGESLIPVWGSGRAAINDFQEGRWGWGLFNAAMAVSDIFLVKALVVGAGKLLVKTAVKEGATLAEKEAATLVEKEATGQALNPRTRLPRTEGSWTSGTPGNGLWKSDIPAVNKVTGGKPIEFVNGRPAFTPWSKGQIKFKPGELNGTRQDFDKVYDYVAKQKNLPSRNAAKNYLRDADLTPHHLDGTTIQLIPSELHNSVPHIGSASDLRGGM